MDTNQKNMKGGDRTTTNQVKDDKQKNMTEKRSSEVNPDDKKGNVKRAADKKSTSTNRK
jgi:hypothetical protein